MVVVSVNENILLPVYMAVNVCTVEGPISACIRDIDGNRKTKQE
jgi:hypothetical protein